MQSLKLTVAYDGTDFCGWQVQPQGRSVQSVLEAAVSTVTGEHRRLIASGRTDAGVHAIGQVVGLKSETRLDAETLRNALNANLPPDIRVRSVENAPLDFHAIRDARAKRYRYVIQHAGQPDPFRRRYSWFLPKRLNVEHLRQASRELVGQRDFASFQAAGSPRKTTVRNVHELTIATEVTEMAEFISLDIEADGFLYNMARNIVGTLVEVGQGKQTQAWIKSVVQACDRRLAGPTAPAQGLFLWSVRY